MSTVTINAVEYPVYADEAFADEYLAADMLRAGPWAALSPTDEARALVSATRLLQRLQWKDGVPDIDAPPLVVQEATSLLAADIAAQPKLGDSGSTGSNIKSVGAGPAKVEFFRPTEGTILPTAAFDLLRDLLGLGGNSDPALDNAAYGSGYRLSRFPPDVCRPYGGPPELEVW